MDQRDGRDAGGFQRSQRHSQLEAVDDREHQRVLAGDVPDHAAEFSIRHVDPVGLVKRSACLPEVIRKITAAEDQADDIVTR